MKILNKEFCIILFLFLISFIPRFELLSKGPFHWDTLYMIQCAEKTLKGKIALAQDVGALPAVFLDALFILIAHILNLNKFFVVNIAVGFGASLSICFFYLFIKELLNSKKAAFYSSILYSFLPPFFSVSTFGRTDHIFSLLFFFISFWLLVKYIKENNLKIYLSSLAFLGLAISTRFPEFLMFLVYLLILFIFGERIWIEKKNLKVKKKVITEVGLAIIIPTVVFFIFYLPFIGEVINRIILHATTEQFGKWAGIYSPYLVISLRYLFKSLSFWGIALSIFGTIILFRNRKYKEILIFTFWFLIMFIFFGNQVTVAARFLITSMIPLLILTSYFITEFLNFFQSFLKINISSFTSNSIQLILVAILIYLTFLPVYPILEFRHNHNMQKEFAMYLKNITEDNAIILAKDEGIFLRYYLGSTNRSITSFPSTCNSTKMKEFFEKMDSWLEENRSVYIIETGLAYDPCRLFLNTLLQNYNLTLVGKHLNEDWHHKSIYPGLFEERVFKITKK